MAATNVSSPASGARSEEVSLAGEVDDPVAVAKAQPPVYPPAMAAAGISGLVRLEFVVDTVGHCEPGSVRVVSSSHPAFEEPARDAVLKTVYRPARSRGRPVRQLVNQSLVFRMD
jgi:TonB family protein